MRRCLLALLTTIALAAGSAGALAGAPAGDLAAREAAATRSAARATLALDRRLRAVARDAGAAAQSNRRAARACLADARAVPPRRREDAFALYFISLASGLWFADEAAFARWVERDLVPAARDSALWRAERRRLAGGLEAGRRIFAVAVPDVCPVLRAWRATGFTPESAPPQVTAPERLSDELMEGDDLAEQPSRRLLRLVRSHLGPRTERRVIRLLQTGVDEPDRRVLRDDDPVARALAPPVSGPTSPG